MRVQVYMLPRTQGTVDSPHHISETERNQEPDRYFPAEGLDGFDAEDGGTDGDTDKTQDYGAQYVTEPAQKRNQGCFGGPPISIF